MHTLTLLLSVVYWALLAAVLGGQFVEGAVISAVLMDLPGLGETRVEGSMASALAIGLPGVFFILAATIALMVRLQQQSRAIERVLVSTEA
ncbi:MAG: hypothetical protein AAF371_04810 [Pseudomonadota bacterium]